MSTNRPAIGTRVGCLAFMDKEARKIHMFGWGTYEGDEVPPQEVGAFYIEQPVPKLKLDDGTIVYGCECWWGESEKMMEDISRGRQAGFEVVVEDLAALRKQNLEHRGALLPLEIEREINRIGAFQTADAKFRDTIRGMLKS